MDWYTSVASKSCLPLSSDAAQVEERINFGPALQPLPLATNLSFHTEAHLKSVIPPPEQPTHVLQQTTKKHIDSSAWLYSPKTQMENIYLEKPGFPMSSEGTKTPPKPKILFFFFLSLKCF